MSHATDGKSPQNDEAREESKYEALHRRKRPGARGRDDRYG